MNSEQFSVLKSEVFSVKINTFLFEFLATFQIWIFPFGAPTLALQLMVSAWFSCNSYGKILKLLGFVAVIN